MRLADFIAQNVERILVEWEHFAASLLPGAEGMTSLELRDHAQLILAAISADLATHQTREAQAEKSKGRAPFIPDTPDTAAQTHAVLRARSGFNIIQLVAEYRALRASVLRLWIDDGPLDPEGVEDIVRFNEAIDQAVAESVGHFHAQVERARNLLLGMLGHDMRSPLNTILTTASYLAALNAGEDVSVAAGRLIRSGASMQALLDDLVDFNRTRLGLGLRVVPAEVDLAAVAADELDQWRATYPTRRIELSTSGDLRGRWDGARLQQVVRNLVSNAVRYGHSPAPVRVAVRGEKDHVCLEVSNAGSKIDPVSADRLFRPLTRGAEQEDAGEIRGGLGLGLFIVREIARAHGGEAAVRTDAGEVTFSVRLPRQCSESRESPSSGRSG